MHWTLSTGGYILVFCLSYIRIEQTTIHTLYYSIIMLWLIQILWIIETLEPVCFMYMYVHVSKSTLGNNSNNIFIFISPVKLFTYHVLKGLTYQLWPFDKIILSALFFWWWYCTQHMNQEKGEAAKYLRLKIVVGAILLVKIRMPDRNYIYKNTVFHTWDLFKINPFII